MNRIMKEDMEYISKKSGILSLLENKTILITGFSGFIGYYLVNFFIWVSNESVRIKKLVLVDSFILGEPDWVKEIIRYHSFVEVHKFDISKDRIEDIASAASCDYILHMASIASPSYYRMYPIKTIEANVLGLKSLLDFYKSRPVSGILFFSSSEVYGEPLNENIPTNENYAGYVPFIGPRACYDESKRIGETLCNAYWQEYKMPISIVRPFNNFGPGMRLEDKRVSADFAKAVLNGEDLVIFSDGLNTRTFCYIADAAAGLIKVLFYGCFDCFNIGIDKPEISINELAQIYYEQAKELWNYGGTIRYQSHEDKEYNTHCPTRRCPDITKARNILGYDPAIQVREGVRRYLEYLGEEWRKL